MTPAVNGFVLLLSPLLALVVQTLAPASGAQFPLDRP